MDESQYLYVDLEHQRMVQEILTAISLHNTVVADYLKQRHKVFGPEAIKGLIEHCRAIGKSVEDIKFP